MFAVKLVGITLYVTAIFGLPLFLVAGTVHWWRAWVLLGVVGVATVVVMLAVFRYDPDLLKERYKAPFQEGQPLSDKVIAILFGVTSIGVLVLTALDVFRLHLLRAPGPVVSALGLALFIAGWWVGSAAEKVNTFAALVVRHQEERGHRVIDTGLYGVIRHPMYAGGILLLVGMPLWLGSTAALLFAVIPSFLLALRAVFEERFLTRELPGYADYMRRVRYRLLPGVW